MSYNNKTFCKVCKDAGKPESEYTSHSVRANNKVICPTLLATECRYCWQKGHTTKFCPALEAKKKAEERQQVTEVKQSLPQIQSIKKRGCFDILAEDSDEEEKFPTLKKAPAATIKLSPKNINTTNDFPALQTKIAIIKPTQMLSGWASIAATPPLQQPVIEKKIVVQKEIKKEIKIIDWTAEESEDEEQVYTDSW